MVYLKKFGGPVIKSSENLEVGNFLLMLKLVRLNILVSVSGNSLASQVDRSSTTSGAARIRSMYDCERGGGSKRSSVTHAAVLDHCGRILTEWR